MKLTKKKIDEIIDKDGDLIGTEDTPTNGANLETQANNFTDYNVKVAHQPYRYDMLGRFGFTLLPFFEGKEVDNENPIVETLASQLFEFYKDILEKYYRHPEKLKSDFRKISKKDYEGGPEEFGFEPAKKIFDAIKPEFEKSLKDLDDNMKENIDESVFHEEKVLSKRDKKDLADKKKDNEMIDKKAKKIADLINKLDKDQVKKIKNLLEVEKNE